MPQFPFGQPLLWVQQEDRRPKDVFVLGVYASAVHARWQGPFGRVQALAVASEPYIFWRGDGASEIVTRVACPKAAGELAPASDQYNGPSGLSLDSEILAPLGVDRDNTWLCDLVPHSCVNDAQKKAIDRVYLPAMKALGLPAPTIPGVPNPLVNQGRVANIGAELTESQARLLILLGDQPIKWFLKAQGGRYRDLVDVCKHHGYGRAWPIVIDGRRISVVALAHPRQVSKLGRSSPKWFDQHHAWKRAGAVL